MPPREVDRHAFVIALCLALTIALAHIVAAWGHVGLFWGDSGRWMHEVERYARGEQFYRDFTWIFPPLGMWLIGGIARLAGPDLNAVLGVTSAMYLLIVVTWVWCAAQIVPPRLLPLTVAAGLLLASALAMINSAPLPVGTYTPAAPVGGLMLLVALAAGLRVRASGGLSAAALLGVGCAACVLAKQDFWAPAAALGVGVSVQILSGSAFADRKAKLLATMYGAGFLTLLVGVSAVLRHNDPGTLPLIVRGFGAAAVGGVRGLPSAGQIVLQIGVSALIAALVILIALATGENRSRRMIRSLGIAALIALVTLSLWLWQAVQIGWVSSAPGGIAQPWTPLQDAMRLESPSTIGLLKRAVWVLIDRLYEIPLPLLVPLALLVVTLASRRVWKLHNESRYGLLLLLLSVCVAARLRRGFEQTDWYQVLLEVPTAIAVAGVAWRNWVNGGLRTQQVLLAVVAIVGAWTYREHGFGPLTRRGRGEDTESARGVVWLARNMAVDLRSLRSIVDSIDPAGMRPLMSTGYASGFNYHLGRTSASSLTVGFTYSNRRNADSIVDAVALRRPPVMLIDHPYYRAAVPVRDWQPLKWERPVEWSYRLRLDRPYFDRLLQACRARRPETTGEVRFKDFVVIDCATRE